MIIENAYMLGVGSMEWKEPKFFLVNIPKTDGRLSDNAKREFEKLGVGDFLIDYTYYGEVEVIDKI